MQKTGRTDKNERKAQHRMERIHAMLRFWWFCGILWDRKALSASAAVMLPLLGVALLCHALEEVLFLSSSEGVSVFTHESPRRNSYMDVLDTVIALLGLLATVIIGTARITWVIAKEIFRNTHDAKHYSKK